MTWLLNFRDWLTFLRWGYFGKGRNQMTDKYRGPGPIVESGVYRPTPEEEREWQKTLAKLKGEPPKRNN